MRMIKCIVADDETLARDVIKSHISKLDRLDVVAVCTNGLEVYTAIKRHKAELLFLDIQMPELTGIELLRTIKDPPSVIITTAYPEFALEGYELNVIDYLLKPIAFERFLKAVDKYESRINHGHTNNQLSQFENLTHAEAFIYVKSDKRMVKIMLRDILYLEGLKDYVKIHTADSRVITYETLTYFEEKLPSGHFMRIHRSYIVSLDQISAFSASELSIGSTTIAIGRTYIKEVTKRLNQSN